MIWLAVLGGILVVLIALAVVADIAAARAEELDA